MHEKLFKNFKQYATVQNFLSNFFHFFQKTAKVTEKQLAINIPDRLKGIISWKIWLVSLFPPNIFTIILVMRDFGVMNMILIFFDCEKAEGFCEPNFHHFWHFCGSDDRFIVKYHFISFLPSWKNSGQKWTICLLIGKSFCT